MSTTFTIRDVFKEAREIIRPKLWRIMGQYAWIFALFMLLSMLSGSNLLLGIVVSSLFAYTTAIVSLGYARHGAFGLADFTKSASVQSFAYFFLAFLVSRLFIVGGIVLLVVPGVILAVALSLVKFLAVESEVDPWTACKESARLTRGSRWKLLWFFVLAALLNILGAVCLVVGLFYTVPMTLVAAALVYVKLRAAKDAAPAPTERAVEAAEPEGAVVDAEVV